jgi:ATP-binding protein involved in chromosome partitioning
MGQSLQERLSAALGTVVNARTGVNVVTSEQVRDIATTLDGRVRVTVLLDPRDDATLVRDVRQAIERVAGVTDIKVDVRDAGDTRAAAAPRATGAPTAPRALPVMDERPTAPRPSVPAPTVYENLGRIIAISSGKGGVGKSTVSANLAVALASRGLRVGLMDADIYGPNIPIMMGVNSPPPVVEGRIMPLEAHGVKLISLGFLIERDQPAIWRGPIVMKVVTQFLRDVAWGDLDYLIVDMPPGTGDAQLSLVQATRVHGAVIVTTPQKVATGDALRGAKMFMRVGVPVLGVVENMSWLECPHCGKPTPLFGEGGGQELADELSIPLLGQIPLYPPIRVGGDAGVPIVTSEPGSSASKALATLAERVETAAGAVVPA